MSKSGVAKRCCFWPTCSMNTNDHGTNPHLDPLAREQWLEEWITLDEAARLRKEHPSSTRRHLKDKIVNIGTRAPRTRRRHALETLTRLR